jgi:hypothetical protein
VLHAPIPKSMSLQTRVELPREIDVPKQCEHSLLQKPCAASVKQPPFRQCLPVPQSPSTAHVTVGRQINSQIPFALHVPPFDPAVVQDAPVLGCKKQPVSGLQAAALHWSPPGQVTGVSRHVPCCVQVVVKH